MNTTKRFVFGLLSSALLAVGLARAADLLDPVNRSLSEAQSTIARTAPNSVSNTNGLMLSAPDSVSNTNAPTLES